MKVNFENLKKSLEIQQEIDIKNGGETADRFFERINNIKV